MVVMKILHGYEYGQEHTKFTICPSLTPKNSNLQVKQSYQINLETYFLRFIILIILDFLRNQIIYFLCIELCMTKE